MSVKHLTMESIELILNKRQLLSWFLNKILTRGFHLRQPLTAKVFPNVTELQRISVIS